MEEARYWMWTKRNETSLSSQVLASTTKSTKYGDSWEEQAFAEDSAGHLGGCIWPPRSYTCSFCRREFRSAQALGGHMNVHRRDRARLKQSPSPINNHLSNPSTSLAIHQHPSLVYTKDSDDQEVLRSPNSRVLAPIMQVRFNEKSLLASSFSSPIFQEQQKKTSVLTPLLWSDFVADRYSNFPDLEKEEKIFNLLESECSMKRDYVEADLSVSLNSIVSGNDKQTASLGEEEDTKSYKRRRTDDETMLFFPARNSVDKNISFTGSELVLEVSPILKEDLDLELRLGAYSVK